MESSMANLAECVGLDSEKLQHTALSILASSEVGVGLTANQ